MHDEENIQFNRWKRYVFRTVGTDPEKIYRYLWDIFCTLTTEINDLNKQLRIYKHQNNGKKDDI
jgi:hypothetical protein